MHAVCCVHIGTCPCPPPGGVLLCGCNPSMCFNRTSISWTPAIQRLWSPRKDYIPPHLVRRASRPSLGQSLGMAGILLPLLVLLRAGLKPKAIAKLRQRRVTSRKPSLLTVSHTLLSSVSPVLPQLVLLWHTGSRALVQAPRDHLAIGLGGIAPTKG